MSERMFSELAAGSNDRSEPQPVEVEADWPAEEPDGTGDAPHPMGPYGDLVGDPTNEPAWLAEPTEEG